DPAEHDRYNPTAFAPTIEVPVFLAGAWQDEQTGPFFFTLLDRFTASPAKRFNVYNGVHPDGFAPQVLTEWHAFLELFVAQRAPLDQPLVRDLSPLLFERIFGASMRMEKSRWTAYTDYHQALAAWRAEPPLRAIFESGGGTDPGAPEGTFERAFDAWPPPETRVARWFFNADGSLREAAPAEAASASSFEFDPDAGSRGILAAGGDVWDKLPAYAWAAPAAGRAVVFESAPLAGDQVLFGSGSVDLWLKSPVDDADLEVNLIEVRPDGSEMYVQSGWVRAGHRKPGPDATELWPAPTYMEKDWAPLPIDTWTEVRVAIAGFGHVFRTGSRIRVTVDTPGDSRAEWRFANKPFPAGTRYAIGHDQAHPSSVALPLIDGMAAPTPLPACPSLRGQPCRPHAAYANTPAQ
ncbi:MAG TPA: CocE/NonD family hydrolase C-terminal non-catalytic domain-containing protein, partial [Kofleriaceae bacterium]|nr:CocE/NonD family hydrolase C-terminal non-catalytic domain-containing protein [Kofleriaceae bacterium]